MSRPPVVAVIIPCYNEAGAIGRVVDAFKVMLPQAELHVFDNASTDGTAGIAAAHGAVIHHVALPGKGNVVRRMFADVEADAYVMTDGDATYDLANVAEMVDGVLSGGLDMVVGARVDNGAKQAYRAGHRFGNRLLTGSVTLLFGGGFRDILSGHRVFSRRYVKTFPAAARGFEVETELTIHALELRVACRELPVAYLARPSGTVSKLSTYRDGWRILGTIGKLFTSERPLAFFLLLAALLAMASMALGIPVILHYFETGLVPRLPTAVLATGTMLSALMSLVCGVVLHNVTLARQEAKRLAFLAIPATGLKRAYSAATGLPPSNEAIP